MKINLPVTAVERHLPAGRCLVSKTDLKGLITYANEAFIEQSGYTREELIGSNHNIVRHPDMPAEAFVDLWGVLKRRLPWRGVVKNRCKNGDYYWVDAFVAPVLRGMLVVGYISVRSRPSVEAIRAAESIYAGIKTGNVALTAKVSRWPQLSIKSRLMALTGCLALIVVAVAFLGLVGIRSTNEALESTYRKGLEPVEMIGQVTKLMNDNRAQVMLALQHRPGGSYASMHDHGVTMHTDTIVRNREQISALVADLQARDLGPEVKRLLDRYVETRDVFVNNGLKPAREAILAGDFDQANRVLLNSINPAYSRVDAAAVEFRDAVKQAAQQAFLAAQERYSQALILAASAVGGSLLFAVLASFWVIRSINRPVSIAIERFAQIAQGDLTGEVDISGRDEIGVLMAHLASMQAQLKFMLSEVKIAAHQIDTEATQISSHVHAVYEHSEQQRDNSNSVASATEEFSQSVHEVAGAARAAAIAAQNSQGQIGSARQSMNASVETTNRVVSSVRESSQAISDLEKVISQIGTVTMKIKDIADQTNLLALNAAIEAARAGDDGRGFAVVADEVRKLAERTAQSTSEITLMVAEIHRVTEESVGAINHVVSEVEDSAHQIAERIGDLESIRGSSEQITDMSVHIADAAQEQASASEQVAHNMEQIVDLIDGNIAYVRSALASADSIGAQSAALRELCDSFKV